MQKILQDSDHGRHAEARQTGEFTTRTLLLIQQGPVDTLPLEFADTFGLCS